MNQLISFRSELLKTKRSPAWILTGVIATFAAIFLLLVFKQEHDGGRPSSVIPIMKKDAWNHYFYQGRGMISFVFLPIFIVLLSALIPQIEYRNHTWKQVLASPQSYSRIYFTKFVVFQLFILVYIITHNLFMGLSALFSDILNPKFDFSANHLDWPLLISNMSKTYLSILALSSFQFWLGMRFKNFIVPIGIGVLLCILGIVNMVRYEVLNPDKYFFTYSAFIFIKENATRIPYALWGSAIYTAAFLTLGFIDFCRAKAN